MQNLILGNATENLSIRQFYMACLLVSEDIQTDLK